MSCRVDERVNITVRGLYEKGKRKHLAMQLMQVGGFINMYIYYYLRIYRMYIH